MADDLITALSGAVAGESCGVSACQTNPAATRNGRPLCAKHRDLYDHGTMGEPCDSCGSRNWIATPDAASVAVCAVCEYVTYDESVIEHSWREENA
ncbi:hypothetical protein [Halostella litorea]|uniref:hypothetical protein n=1 Tax=Halostella litorea TaxID=2528831 RepID=UPI00109265BF|nr:hypothetical protein [Halostella litorea]